MAFDPLNFLYLPPYANVLAGMAPSSTAGTVDTDTPILWLTDLRPAFPTRWVAGPWGASVPISPTAPVQLIVIVNHSLDGNVTVGGGTAGTITLATVTKNKVLLNPYLLLGSPTGSIGSLTFAGTNTNPAIIGEIMAGVPVELRPVMMSDNKDAQMDGRTALSGDYMNIPMFDQRRKWRTFSGTQYYSYSELQTLIDFQDSGFGSSRPGVLITDQAVNDARAVYIDELSYKRGPNKNNYLVTLTFTEHPRYNWIP